MANAALTDLARPGAARSAAQGFTLIELLVVLLIIGTVVGLAVLGVRTDQDHSLEREARRLHAALELAAERAVLEARELGLILEPDGYRFSELRGERWYALEALEPRYLAPHRLPEPLRLEVVIDGLPGGRLPGASRDHRPAILLLSSGELTPFRLRLSSDRAAREAHGYLLRGELGGRLTLEPLGGEPQP